MDITVNMGSYDEYFMPEAEPQHTHSGGAWPLWDPVERMERERLTSILPSAARSSIEPAPPSRDSFGQFWSGDYMQPYDIRGFGSPLSLLDSDATYTAEATLLHRSHQQSQPHNTPGDLIQSSSISSPGFLSFSASQTLPPLISTVSPSASSISSSSSSPSASPDLVQHRSIPILQPRPSRRIPIVSLSALASACDDLHNYLYSDSEKHQPDFPSPPTQDFFARYTPPFIRPDPCLPDFDIPLEYASSGKYISSARIYNDGIGLEGVICSCGCMESFAI